MNQIITPNPYIPCKPGWCLAYVNQAFGRVPIRYGSATAAWNGSATKHRDWNFPNAWVPVWFSLENEPNGHVALRAPDGRVFSTTHPTSLWPTEHPNMAHLLNAYARYNPLTYLGWTEDVEGTAVVAPGNLTFQSETITPLSEEDDMFTQAEKDALFEAVARIDKKADDVYNRVFGRDVQRWYSPNSGEVRTEAFDGSIPARSTDVHDVISTNNLLVSQTNKILDAVANIPGVDAAVVAGLREELSAELKEATANLSVTLTVAEVK